jgi:hypothetical protein
MNFKAHIANYDISLANCHYVGVFSKTGQSFQISQVSTVSFDFELQFL